MEVFITVVWLLTHFLQGRLNKQMGLVDVQCAIPIVIELIPDLLNHSVNDVVDVFVLLTLLDRRQHVLRVFFRFDLALHLLVLLCNRHS